MNASCLDEKGRFKSCPYRVYTDEHKAILRGQIMPRVLTVDGSVKIGAYRFPDRKKPCLCVEKGNVCTVYGSFIDLDRAFGYA